MSNAIYEIKNAITVLSTSQNGWKKELNLISWNNGGTKLDIRDWSPDKRAMKKGITLNREEVKELKHYLDILDLNLISKKTISAKITPTQETIPEKTNEAVLIPDKTEQNILTEYETTEDIFMEAGEEIEDEATSEAAEGF